MTGTIRHIINMANSIIGVSILSMPYCFKESGLVLGILLILLSGFITKKTCMFLIRAAIMARRRSYELLAFQVFGVTGKLLMELCMILFLIGICISFHVVMGDLAPAIMAKYMAVENSSSLRMTLLVGMVILVILPLCLLRNLDSLASMSACSIGFYVFLNCIIFYMALPSLLDGTWIQKAELFRLDSVFRVFPIMTLALACQSNVFEIYESIPDPDVIKMKSVVSQAVNICCALYIGVGFLGYVAFVDRDISGNVIMSFPVSKLTDGITIFFVFSLAISFPLIMFPCRTSIHSLIYKRNTQITYDIVGNYMPESRFKGITLSVLSLSLIIGIMLPSIEFVLGLLGSTMGVIIALILPSVFYIRVYTKISCDRLLAQGFFLLGIVLMVTGTYLHLSRLQDTKPVGVTIAPVPNQPQELLKMDVVQKMIQEPDKIGERDASKDTKEEMTGRKEPAIPEPPPNVEKVQPMKSELKDLPPPEERKEIQKKSLDSQNVPPSLPDSKAKKGEEKGSDLSPGKEESAREEDLHPDAIKKEEKENAEEAQVKAAPPTHDSKENIEKKQELILKQMESQQKEQKMLIEEQKKILQELKDQKEKVEMENGVDEVKEEESANAGQPLDVGAPIDRVRESPLGQSEQLLVNKDPLALEHSKLELDSAQGANADIRKPVLSPEVPQVDLKRLPRYQIPVVNKDQPRLPNRETIGGLPVGDSPGKESMISYPSQVGPGISHNLSPQNVPKQEQVNALVEASPFAPKPLHDLVENPSLNKISSNKVVRNVANPKKNLEAEVQRLIHENLKPHQKPLVQEPEAGFGKSVKMNIDNGAKVVPAKTMGKASPEENGVKHDEERRKRDLVSVEEVLSKKDPDEETKIQHSERLSFDVQSQHLDADRSAKDAEDKAAAVAAAEALYDTRHLLWVGRRTRRKKRRQEQFPNYWDEM